MKMLFSELYSLYYNTVAKILTAALRSELTEEELNRLVAEYAFSESALTLIPAMKSGKWPLLRKDLSPVVKQEPTMPLTTLEKQWLRAVLEDPRIRLFGVEISELANEPPLFTPADYRIYDQYADGDPFEDENYIWNFRLIRTAIREKRPLRITIRNRWGRPYRVRLIPVGFEYSVKDDKLRVLATGCRFRHFNLGRVIRCEYDSSGLPLTETAEPKRKKTLTLLVTDQRNALERVMLHFAHFEKQAERAGDGQYLLHLRYYESDETEMVIRILSFGPFVKVVAPEDFIGLIRQRLLAQKICGLR
jgi:hypothetical protein